MKGSNSHITVTAYHEAGHALAALKQGRFVKTVEVSLINPGNGRTIIWLARKNPYDLVRHPDLAWRHTYNNTLEEIFVLLAGPIAEARCLGKPIRSLKGHSGAVQGIAFAAGGKSIAAACADHAVHIWDASSGKLTATLAGHAKPVKSVAYSPDGRTIASGSTDATVRLWNAKTAEETATLRGHTNTVYCVTFSQNGRLLATASFDRTIRLWSLQTQIR